MVMDGAYMVYMVILVKPYMVLTILLVVLLVIIYGLYYLVIYVIGFGSKRGQFLHKKQVFVDFSFCQ